jgi:hypothetical protein
MSLDMEANAFAQAVESAQASSEELRVLISGARTWTDLETIRRELAALPSTTVIIHGDARGADRLAGQAAAERGLRVLACPPEWNRYGKAAGLVRNRQMLEEHRPHLLLAFHPAIDVSRGTRNMVELARKAGVPVRIVVGKEGE